MPRVVLDLPDEDLVYARRAAEMHGKTLEEWAVHQLYQDYATPEQLEADNREWHRLFDTPSAAHDPAA